MQKVVHRIIFDIRCVFSCWRNDKKGCQHIGIDNSAFNRKLLNDDGHPFSFEASDIKHHAANNFVKCLHLKNDPTFS